MQEKIQRRFSRFRAGATGAIAAASVVATLSQPAMAQVAAAVSGAGPDGVGMAMAAETSATVIGIDTASNSITLRGAGGHVADIVVNPEVGDVSKLQIGDTLNIAYRNALLIHVDKVKSDGIRERIEQTATIPVAGGVGATARRIQVLATIQKLDVKKRTVTLRGPSQSYTTDVAPDVSLAGLKVGDSVSAEFISATAVQVTRNGAPIK
jgi:Cu/Ag efflux protein CusF